MNEPTVAAYLAELDGERRETVERALELVRAHLPPGYRETIQHGMISWVIPLADYPYTYNGQPLAVASLASQKRHVALYLHGVYMDDEVDAALRAAYAAAGTKPDMGKSCLRFRRWEEVVDEAVGAAVAAIPPARFIAAYEAAQGPDRMAKHRRAAAKRAAREGGTP
jgi:hypothetical protein